MAEQKQTHSEKYPEHQKLRGVSNQSHTIGAFLERLREEGIELCTMDDRDEYVPIGRSFEQVLADYFEIDLDRIEAEKDAMLAELREAQS